MKNGQRIWTDISPQTTYILANKHMKRCATSLIREMKTEITMRSHLTPTRMAIIKTARKCWWGCGKKGILPFPPDGPIKWCSHYRKQHGASSKTKNRATVSSSNSKSGIYLEPPKALIQKFTCTSVFPALFTTAKIWKQPKYPSMQE